MELICKHDPLDPDHLICESKHPRAHRLVDIFLGGGIIIFAGIALWLFLSRGQGVDNKIQIIKDKISIATPVKDNTLSLEDSPLYSGQTLPLFESQALYYSAEGEQLGRGPWPPKAGETTKIMVFWKIQEIQELPFGAPKNSPLLISGKLGPNAKWTGFAPIGKGLFYELSTKTVKWVVSGQSAVFEVAITPTASQIQDNQITVVDNLKIQEKNIKAGETKQVLAPDVMMEW